MPEEKKITLRLFAGKDDDLLAWLESLHVPHGEKGETIKNAIRRGLALPQETPSAALEAGTLLADIRQVVEATLQTTLAGLSLYPAESAEATEADETIEACLYGLGQELLLDTEEQLSHPGESW